jgi:hypothetical protein
VKPTLIRFWLATPASRSASTLSDTFGSRCVWWRTLDERFADPRVDTECWLTAQMLSAVQVIHDEAVVHSDLKPANFVLVKGRLKLIDFGISKAIAGDTTNIGRDQQIGTANYMPPEALNDTGLGLGGKRLMKVSLYCTLPGAGN